MPTRRSSRKSPRNSRSASKPEHSAAGRRLIHAARQILAHSRGEINLPVRIYQAPHRVDVRSIRAKTGLSQASFAQRYALSVRAVQDWEQGRRQPEAPVRAYLTVIDHEPEAVVRALQAGS